MGLVLLWWLAVELVGLVSLPLAATVFARLPDRGWALAKPLGILVLGWLIWFPLVVFTGLPYAPGWIVATFLAFAAGNAALLRRPALRASLRTLLTSARLYIVASEALFALAFALMAWLRAFTPAVVDTEKFMDVAFLSALWRTPHLPPPDPWLSGYPINYYYFGHFLVATFAKVLGTQPGTAFNLGIALVFALTAVAVFGVAANLVAALRGGAHSRLLRSAPCGLFAVFLVLVAGNLRGAQSWWHDASCAALGKPVLPQPCFVPLSPALHGNPWVWWQHRELWPAYEWWPPSRVIPLANGGSTINEFPAFSFVLADLHAHVLALPFAALAVGIALSLLLGRGAGLAAFGAGRLRWLSLGVVAIALGALYALNGWDLPTYLGLALLALGIQQWLANGRRLDAAFARGFFAPGALLVALSILLYLPFYRSFVSPSQGLAAVGPADHSLLGDELAIFGLPLFILGSLLVVWLARWAGDTFARWLWRADIPERYENTPGWPWLLRHARAVGAALALCFFAVLALVTLRTPQSRGWTLFWCLVLVLGCGALVLRHLLPIRLAFAEDGVSETTEELPDARRAEVWLLCLVGTTAALVAACELVYLRDIFDSRMNTVFKLYFQAWLLLGLAAAPALALLLGPAWRALAAAVTTLRAYVSADHAQERSQAAPSASMALSAAGLGGVQSFQTTTRQTASGGGMHEERKERDAASDAPVSAARTQRHSPPVLPLLLRCAGAVGILCWMALLVALVGAALIYPVLATSARTDNFGWRPSISASGTPAPQLTLDGTAYMADDSEDAPAQCAVAAGSNRGDNRAIDWLNRHIAGSVVILEAPGCEWSHYSRISAFTGLPTLLGWPGGHEGEWRTNWLPQQSGDIFGQRMDAINTIYTSNDRQAVLSLLHRYSVGLVYVGAAERNLHPNADLDRFGAYLDVVYRQDGITIYAVP